MLALFSLQLHSEPEEKFALPQGDQNDEIEDK